MLKPLHPDHFEEIVSWVKNPEEQAIWSATSFPFPVEPAHLQTLLDKPNCRAFVLEYEGQTVACGDIMLNEDGISRLCRLMVKPEARGKHLGRKLVEELLAFSLTHFPERKVRLNVMKDNARAVALYNRMGFVKTDLPEVEVHVPGMSLWVVNMEWRQSGK